MCFTVVISRRWEVLYVRLQAFLFGYIINTITVRSIDRSIRWGAMFVQTLVPRNVIVVKEILSALLVIISTVDGRTIFVFRPCCVVDHRRAKRLVDTLFGIDKDSNVHDDGDCYKNPPVDYRYGTNLKLIIKEVRKRLSPQ